MIQYDPNRPVLFLDIDGVLNDHPPFDERIGSSVIQADKVKLLNFVLEHSNAQIVLSSAWRYLFYRGEMNLEGLSWLLRSHGIWNRFVSITRRDKMEHHVKKADVATEADIYQQFPRSNERGQQIADWRAANAHNSNYAVVDDGATEPDGTWTDLGIGAAGHPFERTESNVGLTPSAACELSNLLIYGPTRKT